jgi:hypothetical protein
MYKLPKDFDGKFFVGKTLENVSFSENTVFFGFGEHVSVTVMSSLQHQYASESEQSDIQHVPLTESKLMQLPGSSVIKVKGDEDGTLTLFFNSGHILRIFDDLPNYESYSFSDGKHEIYV